jgi:hypothetical protein
LEPGGRALLLPLQVTSLFGLSGGLESQMAGCRCPSRLAPVLPLLTAHIYLAFPRYWARSRYLYVRSGSNMTYGMRDVFSWSNIPECVKFTAFSRVKRSRRISVHCLCVDCYDRPHTRAATQCDDRRGSAFPGTPRLT